jgi:hypothetical protein
MSMCLYFEAYNCESLKVKLLGLWHIFNDACSWQDVMEALTPQSFQQSQFCELLFVPTLGFDSQSIFLKHNFNAANIYMFMYEYI